jgi:hypothetical protein
MNHWNQCEKKWKKLKQNTVFYHKLLFIIIYDYIKKIRPLEKGSFLLISKNSILFLKECKNYVINYRI